MSTESFDRVIIINDDKTAEVFIKGLEKPQRPRSSKVPSYKIATKEMLAKKFGKR